MTERRTQRPRTATAAALGTDIESDLASLVASSGCELLSAEWKGGVLRLVIDRLEGVSIAHCEDVAKQASALLDVRDFGAGRYTLEVSSPGLDRPLYRPSDYERFLGRLALVTFTNPETEKKRTIIGRLVEYV